MPVVVWGECVVRRPLETIWVEREVIRSALESHRVAQTAEVRAEPCGYLLSASSGRGARIVDLVAGDNVHSAPERDFALSDDERQAVAKKATEAGRELAGLWVAHVHGPAKPSRSDWEGLRTTAEAGGPSLLLVVGAGSGTSAIVRAYRCKDADLEEVRVQT